MNKLIFAAVLAILFLAPSAKAATLLTGGDLEELCSEAPNTIEGSTCLGYIAGWLDGIDGMQLILDGKIQTVVFEDGITTTQLARVYLKYIKANPDKENKPANLVLGGALIEAHLMGFAPAAPESETH